MKIAKVIPVYKKDDNQIFSNYRPISLLPSFSKILEKVVHKRLLHYLNIKNIISFSQYGFQPNSSTELAVLELQDRIVKSMATHKFCLGLSVDLSKAFDTLNHDILFTKLEILGIRGITLSWFKSYLSNRKQFVKFKNSNSTLCGITCGVPQGSILGPLLFLIYMNDLPTILSSSVAILFADDTTLLIDHSNYDSLIDQTNLEVKRLYKWFCANKLSMNKNKTNYIVFHSQNKRFPPNRKQVVLNNTPINEVDCIKFLGMHLDKHLNWKTHLTKKGNQILKVVAILAQLKHSLPQQTLRMIYTSLVLPHITYGVTAWGNEKNSEMNRINILQKKAIRQITNMPYNSHTAPLFKNLNLLTIDNLFTLNCCKLYHKVINKTVRNPYFLKQLPTNKYFHNYNTRQKSDIHHYKIKTNREKQSVNFKISNSWNCLPDNLKLINVSQQILTKSLKKYFISKYPDACQDRNCYICKKQSSQ